MAAGPGRYWGISSATGDLVDNHDIIQFVVRPLSGVADPDADYEAWAKAESRPRTWRTAHTVHLPPGALLIGRAVCVAQAEREEVQHRLEEFDLRPAESLQRDYQRVLRAQAFAIKQMQARPSRGPRVTPTCLTRDSYSPAS